MKNPINNPIRDQQDLIYADMIRTAIRDLGLHDDCLAGRILAMLDQRAKEYEEEREKLAKNRNVQHLPKLIKWLQKK